MYSVKSNTKYFGTIRHLQAAQCRNPLLLLANVCAFANVFKGEKRCSNLQCISYEATVVQICHALAMCEGFAVNGSADVKYALRKQETG